MRFANLFRESCRYVALGSALLSTVTNLVTPSLAAETHVPPTATPIKHVIVIMGENRSFDHLFATYKAPAGQSVDNLLSKGILNADGTPGPNFKLATQFKAIDVTKYSVSPFHNGPYTTLPPTNTQGTPTAPSDAHHAPFQTVSAAELAEPGLLHSD